jgi:hypothetical protein
VYAPSRNQTALRAVRATAALAAKASADDEPVPRGGAEHGLEVLAAFLEIRLVAVGGEQFGVCEVVVVADERELPVGGGVVGDLLVVDGEGEREDRLGGFAVARLLSWAAALLLAEAFLLGPGDLERQPAFGAGAGQRVVGGLLGGDARFES